MVGTWPVRLVFEPVRNVDISILVYILAGMAGTSTILTTLIITEVF